MKLLLINMCVFVEVRGLGSWFSPVSPSISPFAPLSSAVKATHPLQRGKTQSTGSRPLARATLGAGVLAGSFAAGSDRMSFPSVLSDARPLLRALEHGWCFALLSSASLFALSLRSGLY